MNSISILGVIIVCWIIPYSGLWIAKKYNIVEHQKRANYYKRKPVANMQGIALWITLLCCIALIGGPYIYNIYTLIYIGATGVLAFLSTWDLLKPIASWIRLIVQIILFGSIVIYGGMNIDSIYIGGNLITIPQYISVIGSVLWFIVCTNAVNRFDGIQGQSSGITSIGSFSLLAVIILIVLPTYNHITPTIVDQLTVTQYITLSLGLVSFIYTIIEYKPRGLIRDIGTTIYGFSLAYLALLGGAKVGTLMVTLSLVLFDRVRVILYRICILKKSPLKGDYTHLHHRLLANGWTINEVRWFVWIWSTVMTILMLLQGTNSTNKWIIMIMMAILFFGVNIYIFIIKKLPIHMNIDFTTEEVEKLN